jgi:hypothetical protein
VLHREGEAHAKLLAATALTLASALAPAININVRNCSTKAISANVPVMAAGHKELHGTLTPNATSGAWKSGGKVLVPHGHAVTTSAALHHVDASGAGCRFPLEIRRPLRRQRTRSAGSWCRQPGSATASCPVQSPTAMRPSRALSRQSGRQTRMKRLSTTPHAAATARPKALPSTRTVLRRLPGPIAYRIFVVGP